MDQSALDSDRFRELIEAARGGCRQSLDQLLLACRGYMLSVANDDLDTVLAPKLGASDIVQESMLEAHRDIQGFRGNSEAELLGWLRRIVKHNLHDVRRQYLGTEKRSVEREASIDREPALEPQQPSHNETPSRYLAGADEARRLNQAMATLNQDYQRVIQLRNWELRSFAEIGTELDRSEDAARKLWARAVTALKKEMLRQNGSQ